MRRPIRAHRPLSVLIGSPNRGTNGQKIHRPTMTSSAGSRIIMTRSAQAMPTAPTGPRPLVEFIWANIRHSSPTMTVAPLARTAGAARCRAWAIASCRSSKLCSSSR